MINSVNPLEFLKPKLITMDKFNSTTTTKLLPPTSLSQTRTFVKISGHHHQEKQQQQIVFNDEIKQHQERVRVQHLENHTKLQNNKCWNNFRTLCNNVSASSVTSSSGVKKDNDNEIDVVNVEHYLPPTTTQTPINIQNKSAFNLDINNKKYNNNNNSNCGNNNLKIDATRIVGSNNNYPVYCKQYINNYGLVNKQTSSTPTTTTTAAVTMTVVPGIQTQASINNNNITQRTEDQNNAYRHIESVHNYAKSKSYEDDDDDNHSPNGSRHSSYLDDDDEDDDDEDDDDEDDNDGDIDAAYDNDESNIEDFPNDLDDAADYEDIFNRRRHRRLQKLSTSSDGALTTTRTNRFSNIRVGNSAHFVNVLKDHKICDTVKRNDNKNNLNNEDEEDDVHIDVDVETVESQSSPNIPVADMNSSLSAVNNLGEECAVAAASAAGGCVKPDHHARRPMNAFLIFCKRHRAIVKERYKNLENRAITKILGDWWASLDANEKKCFTNLAQQNKDAFFSANPNFKWYKLPAPPLRTLTTRPANAFGQEYQEDNNDAAADATNTSNNNALEIISNNTRSCNSSNHGNYFKLADEAQMGDLSQLMQDKSKTTKQTADLQQALGETSQFMSAHITGNADGVEDNNPLKRRFHNENSFSSNSSEDDNLEPKKKSARSCKGKRYQELINSGQIATAVKKSKSSIRLAGGENNDGNVKQSSFSNVNNFNSPLHNNNNNNNVVCQKRSVSESENMLSYDLNGFDLEERIKELPALNLDDYLQRKRNTKKKKKFSTNGKKQRGQRANNNGNNNNNEKSALQTATVNNGSSTNQNAKQTATAAVGSQKRKARKESITRRDVSAIEQEVASLLPLTINGCCYFQEAPTAMKFIKAIDKDNTSTAATAQSLNVTTTTSPIIPLQQFNNNTSSSVSVDIFNNINNNTLNDNISSSTSDLLILAEVAANRTELKH